MISRLRILWTSPRALTRVLNAIFVLLAILLCTQWFVRQTAPRPVAALPTTVLDAAPRAVQHEGGKVFGSVAHASGLDGIELIGVYALGNGDGVALLRVASKAVSLKVGEAVTPGAYLTRVATDRVVLSINGHEHELPMPVRQ